MKDSIEESFMQNKRSMIVEKMILHFRTFNKIQKQVNISAHASSVAFFLFLSIIPLIMMACALLQYAPGIQMELWSYVSKTVIPKTVVDFLMDIVNTYQGRSVTIVSVSAVITVWSASKGMLALMRGMNAVYELQESRNYVMLRLRALVYTIFFMIAILVSIVLLVFGNAVVELLTDILIIGEIWRWLQTLRHLIVAVFLAVVFCSFYCLLPNNKMPWRQQLPGAFVASVFWIVYSFLFSIYIDYFNGFSMYGSLTTVIIVMIWFYFCMYIFFCGVVINRILNNENNEKDKSS